MTTFKPGDRVKLNYTNDTFCLNGKQATVVSQTDNFVKIQVDDPKYGLCTEKSENLVLVSRTFVPGDRVVLHYKEDRYNNNGKTGVVAETKTGWAHYYTGRYRVLWDDGSESGEAPKDLQPLVEAPKPAKPAEPTKPKVEELATKARQAWLALEVANDRQKSAKEALDKATEAAKHAEGQYRLLVNDLSKAIKE